MESLLCERTVPLWGRTIVPVSTCPSVNALVQTPLPAFFPHSWLAFFWRGLNRPSRPNKAWLFRSCKDWGGEVLNRRIGRSRDELCG
jgi:hypothetical protein